MTVARRYLVLVLVLVLVLLATACSSQRTAADATTETSSDSSTSESEGDETNTEGPLFAPTPDEPGSDECSMLEQDCPEGEKCVPYSRHGGVWDAFECVPVLGDQTPGEPCTYDGTREATDDCDQDGLCWDVMDVDGQSIGTCRAFCSPECPAGSFCGQLGQIGIAFCVPQCDPIAQDCGAGLGCFWANDQFTCIFTTRDLPAGEPCGFVNDCAAGGACLGAEYFPACAGESCCSDFCDIELGDAQCEAVPGTSCVAFFEADAAPPGFEHVGVCVAP